MKRATAAKAWKRGCVLAALALASGQVAPGLSHGAQDERFVVAVPPFRAADVSPTDKDLGVILAEAMSGGLRVVRGLKVIEPGPLSKAMEQHGMRWGETANSALLPAAKSLSADLVVEGRFHREGNTIRLQARVIDLEGQREAPSLEEAPAPLSDLFAAQGRLTLAVVKRLGVSIGATDQARLVSTFSRPTDSLPAYAYYARARRQFTLQTKEGYGLAVELLFRAIGIDSNFALAHHELGLVFMAMNNRWRAAGEFRKAIQLNSNLPESYKNLGDLFFTSPRRLYIQAIEAYSKALELYPEYMDAHIAMAETLSAQGKQDEAIAAFKRALTFDADEPRIHFGLGKIYYNEKGLFHEATAEYQRAIEINPRYLDAHVHLGELYEEKGLYKEAVSSYERALELDPKHLSANYGVALALENLDRDRAIAAWERYIRIASERSSEKDWLDIAKKHLKRLKDGSGERKGQ